MPLKVLSGIVVVKQNDPNIHDGRMNIDLTTHAVQPISNGSLVERSSYGIEGRYVSAPCKHVAIRQFKGDVPSGPLLPATFNDIWIEINDSIDRDHLRIRWQTLNLHPSEFQFEISYMVLGEAEEPDLPQPWPGVVD